MAIRISKEITTRFKIVNVYTDNTSDENIFAKGDVVENLKFVTRSKEVETVSGKIIEVRLTTKKLTWHNNNTVCGKAEDVVSVKEIVLDCSEANHSKKVVVPTSDVLEFNADASKEVKNVDVVPIFDVDVTLADGSLVSFSEGDTFSDVQVTFTKFPLNFKVDAFIYDLDERINLIKPVGIADLTSRPKVYVRFKEIISCGSEDTMKVFLDSSEAAVEALNNLEDGQILVFNTDVEITQTIQIPEGVAVTLDLGDHAIVVPEPVNNRSLYALDNYGDLTITGGVISARGIENFGKMTIEDIDITSRDTNGGAAIWNEGDLVINGGLFKTSHEGSVKDNSGPGCLNNRGTCVINAGEFRSVNNRCYTIISSGEITIEDNDSIEIIGAHGGLSIDSGTAVIKSGTYTSSNFYGLYVSNDGTGTPQKAQVTVLGGEFTGKTKSVWIGSDVNKAVDSVIDIQGGTFNNPLSVQDNVVEGGGIKISGGLFSDPVPEAYCVGGYTCSEEPNEDGYYTIVPAADEDGE